MNLQKISSIDIGDFLWMHIVKVKTAQRSKMNQTARYKLQTRLQFNEHKKLKTYLIVRIKLFINENA